MTISMIAAIGKNYVIGSDQKLPWHLPDDLKFFKDMTIGKSMIMGRKTYEAFGRPLPERQSIVMTSDTSYQADGVNVVHDVASALEAAEQKDEIMIVGGSTIYQLFLPQSDVLYLTHVDAEPNGDVFFPKFDQNDWKIEWQKPHAQDDKHAHSFVFTKYVRSDG